MIRNQVRRIYNFFNKPYDLLQDRRVKLLMVGSGLFILLLVVLLSPFEIVVWSDLERFKLILIACGFGIIITAIHLYLIQDLIFKRFTVLTTIIWWIWINLVTGFSNFFLYCIFENKGVFLWKYLPNEFLAIILLDIMPAIIIILLYHIYFLKSKIKAVNQINYDLSRYQSVDSYKTNLTLTSKNMREVLTLNSDSLLYITSADNYVESYWLENGQIRKCLLRTTLTEIAEEIEKQCRHIRRCHNSYIVNIKKISSISGNSGGYQIFLQGNDFPIPISRKYKDVFFKQFRH